MSRTELNRIAYAWALAAAAVIMLLLSSCMTPQKAITELDKHPSEALGYAKKKLNDNTGEAAKFCDTKFPVFDQTNDSAYRAGQRVLDSIIQVSQAEQEHMKLLLSRMYEENEALKYAIPPNCDSALTRMQSIALQEKVRADKLQEDNRKMIAAARDMAPIETIRKSTAAIIAAEDRMKDAMDAGLQLSRENDQLRDQRDEAQRRYEQEVSKHKGTVAVPWWILAAIGGFFVVSAVKKSLNPINWFV